MGSRPVEVIVAVGVPKGCHCKWTPRYQDTGGDVRVEWLLIGLDPRCHIHEWVQSHNYPLAKDS